MTPSLLPAASQGSLGTDSASSNSKTGELVTKVAVFGAAVGLAAYVGRRYLTFRRRCLALDKHTAPGTDVDETFHTQPGSSLENAPTALVLSNEGPGVSPFQEGFARKSSAELSMLGSFLRHSVKGFGSRGSSESGSNESRSGVGSAERNNQAVTCFDSAHSRNAGTLSAGRRSISSDSATDLARMPEAWNIVEFHELDLGKTIGEGSFGQVFLAKYCHTPVAVKMLTPPRDAGATASVLERSVLKQLSKEAGIMVNLRHPNVTQYLGICMEPPCLLMEYCSRRSVDSVIKTAVADPKAARQLSWARLLSMAHDAAKGMLYLHSRHPPVVHRDLKSANLLVDAHWHVKVADFNLSKALDVNNLNSTVCITNPRWLAPEVLQGGQATLPSDVWAFGTVMWELMTWQLPFERMNPFQIIVTVTRATRGAGLTVPLPDQLPAGPFASYSRYVDLMRSCWARDPAARPTMDQVVSALQPMLSTELRRLSSGARELSTLPSAAFMRRGRRGGGSAALPQRNKGAAGGGALHCGKGC